VCLATILAIVAPTGQRVSGFTPTDDAHLFPDLDARVDQVRAVEIQSSDRSLRFERGNGEWRLPQHHGYPARGGKVDGVLRGLAALRAGYVSDDPAGIEGSGLANPDEPSSEAVRVRLLSSDNDVIAGAIIGHEITVPGKTDQARMLVRRESGKQTWLASPVVRIETDPRAWLEREILNVPRERVTRMVSVTSNGDRIVLERSDKEGLHIAEGSAESNLAGDPRLEAVASALEDLKFDDVRPADTMRGRARDEGRTVVTTAGRLDYTIRWLSDEDDTWATFSAHAAEAPRRAERFNARHAMWAYRLPLLAQHYLQINAIDLSDPRRSSLNRPSGTGEQR
jgi:hypothetical protein